MQTENTPAGLAEGRLFLSYFKAYFFNGMTPPRCLRVKRGIRLETAPTPLALPMLTLAGVAM